MGLFRKSRAPQYRGQTTPQSSTQSSTVDEATSMMRTASLQSSDEVTLRADDQLLNYSPRMVSILVGPAKTRFSEDLNVLKRSPVLAAFLKTESVNDELELPMEDPTYFKRTVDYLHHRKYQVMSKDTRSEIHELCQMLIVADRYGLSSLMEELVGHMRRFGRMDAFLADYSKTFFHNVYHVYQCVPLEDDYIRACVRGIMKDRRRFSNYWDLTVIATCRHYVALGGPLADDIFVAHMYENKRRI